MSNLKVKKNSRGIVKANLDSPQKQLVRKLLIDSLPESPFTIFTLGGKDLIDAKLFTKTYPECRVISIERDPVIYKKQNDVVEDKHKIVLDEEIDHSSNKTKKYMRFSRIIPLQFSFSDFVNIVPRFPKFDLLFIDYNGILSTDVERDMETLIAGVDKGAIIGLTLSYGHDSLESIKDTYCFNVVCGKRYAHYKKYRETVIPQTIIGLGCRSGRDVKLVHFTIDGEDNICYKYRNDNKENGYRGSAMMFWIFKVVK